MSRGSAARACGPLLFALAALLYAPSLRFDFAYDDAMLILEPERAGSSPRQALRAAFTERHFPGLPYWRPLPAASLALQRALHGAEPALFHAGNVLLAGVAAWVALLLLRAPPLGLPVAVAAGGAALFAAHPVVSAGVHPISGREALLAATLAAGALAAWLRPGAGARGLALLLFGLALLARESAVAVAGLFLLADGTGLAPGAPAGGARAAAWLRRHAPVWMMLAAYGVARAAVLGAPGLGELAFLAEPQGPPLSLLYTLLVCLTPTAALRYEPRPEVWLTAGRMALALLAAAALVLWTARQRERPVRRRALFFAGWFGVALLPAANLLRQEAAFAERHAILPLLGLVGWGAVLLAGEWPRRTARAVAVPVALTLLLLLAGLSIARGPAYRDQQSFLEQWVRSDPGNAKAHYSLGLHQMQQGRPARAEASFRRALELAPAYPSAWNNLAALARARGEPEVARTHLREALRHDPTHALAQANLGALLAEQGQLADAARHLRASLAADPDQPRVRNLLAAVEEQSTQGTVPERK